MDANVVWEPRPDPYQDLRLDSNLKTDISNTVRAVEEYEERLAWLSPVDKEGNSENGYAEAEYARVEKIAERLRCEKAHWEKTLMIVDAELTKLVREYQQIERDGRDIAMDGPRRNYEKAVFDQNRRRRKVEQERDQITDILARIKRALREGDKVKWPLGTPKAPPPALVKGPQAPSPSPLGPTTVTCPQIPLNQLGSAIEGLLKNGTA